ncbi:MAG: hypothetical protein HYX53_00605 [Chloroflexi bacterium]|nr:hypothetical protein [Chloroflexota bacterium]
MLKVSRNAAAGWPAADWLRSLSARLEPFHIALGGAIFLAIVVRAAQVLPAHFPLNDGGLFFAMARDIQAAHFRLPEFTSYNGGQIPFGYPPLAFYIAAVLDEVTPLSLPALFRLLPLLFTGLTVVAVYQLARDMLPSKVAVVASVAAFGLIPRAFIWLLMGGGIARSLGFLFAVLALHQVYLLYTKRDNRYLPLAILFAGGTVLSHLETAWFLAFSIAVFWVATGLHRQGLISSAWLLAGTAALTAPWWGTVVAYHGIGLFLDANSTGGNIFSDAATRSVVVDALARGVSTSEPYFPVIGALGLLGALVCFTSNRFLLPAWWIAIVLLDERSYATFASIPVALMAGIAIAEVVLPVVNRPSHGSHAGEGTPAPAPARNDGAELVQRYWKAALVIGWLLYYVTVPTLANNRGEETTLRALSSDQRSAMAWIASSTPTNATFLVIPQAAWEVDKESEWFPALTGRQSIATVQGSEWLPDGAFARAIYAHDRAWGCAGSNAACLDRWSADVGKPIEYVFLPSTAAGKLCCTELYNSLWSDDRYELVYDSAGGAVFKRSAPAAMGPVAPDG